MQYLNEFTCAEGQRYLENLNITKMIWDPQLVCSQTCMCAILHVCMKEVCPCTVCLHTHRPIHAVESVK